MVKNEHNTATNSNVRASNGATHAVYRCNNARRNCRENFDMEQNKRKGIMVPIEAHEWLLNKVREVQGTQPMNRVTLGDVVLDVIRAVEDYE
jgi:hypothetical protein